MNKNRCELFGGPMDSLPPELLCKIFSYHPPSSDRNLALVCKLWNACVQLLPHPSIQRFGPKEWKKYYGWNVEGDVPSLPVDIGVIARRFQRVFCNQTQDSGCTLLLIPEGLTLNKLNGLVQNRKRGRKTCFKGGSSREILDKIGDRSVKQSYWVMMTQDILPGSRSKSYNAQVRQLENRWGKECRPPRSLEVAVRCFVHYAQTGEHLYGYIPSKSSSSCLPIWTYTRCEDTIYEIPIQVGGFTDKGLELSYIYGKDSVGVGACLRFPYF